MNPTVNFYVNKTTPQNRRNDPLSHITWYFGDGSGPVTTEIGWQQHTFPGPGNYQVTAVVRNLAADNPGSRIWTETIVIDAPAGGDRQGQLARRQDDPAACQRDRRSGHRDRGDVDLHHG